jgi:hypothetical protein
MKSMLAALCFVSLALNAAPADAPKKTALDPALPPNPEIQTIIDNLGDNCSAILPAVKVVGPVNQFCKEHYMDKRGPNGRDYTNKAVWMPDRERAFFCGANHQSPHRLNDAWEYDLLSNTWALLYEPDPNNAVGVMEIADAEIPGTSQKVKYVRTKRGGPTHYGHTWWAFCYDPQMKTGLWMNVAIGTSPGKYIEQQTGSNEGAYGGPPLWAFYPETKKWQIVLSPGPYPAVSYAKQMEYVPEVGGPLFMSGGWNGCGTWSYDPKLNQWKQQSKVDKEAPENESLTCYDAKRKLIIGQSHVRKTHHYDIATHKWQQVLDPGKDSTDAPCGHDARSVMYYDTFNHVALLFESKQPDTVWSYDPDSKKWTANKVTGPAVPEGRTIGYFDEARNVFVINRGANTWVYRYKRAAK